MWVISLNAEFNYGSLQDVNYQKDKRAVEVISSWNLSAELHRANHKP